MGRGKNVMAVVWKEGCLEKEIFTDEDGTLEVKEAVSRRGLTGSQAPCN